MYNINEVAKHLNISKELLRHYERKGLISPARNTSGYRNYNINEINILLGIRRFRNMGYSLEDIEKLIYDASYDEVKRLMHQHCLNLEKEIAWKQMVLEHTKRLCGEFDAIPKSTGVFTLCESPAMLRITVQNNFQLTTEDFSPEILRWVDCMPIVQISPAFSRAAVEQCLEELSFGYAVPLHLAEPLGLSDTPEAAVLPSTQSLSFFVYSKGDNYLSAKTLGSSLSYCRDKGLAISGDPWGVTIGTYIEKGEPLRYHKIYMPVNKL